MPRESRSTFGVHACEGGLQGRGEHTTRRVIGKGERVERRAGLGCPPVAVQTHTSLTAASSASLRFLSLPLVFEATSLARIVSADSCPDQDADQEQAEHIFKIYQQRNKQWRKMVAFFHLLLFRSFVCHRG